ncbi:HAMP domain-containing sensor histidine kinase [Asticcacaulis sp. EMRT-3]|uniref:sensor histidine kinase n=1 Tax=Asticcacaulis sp. EMRT-3 TaxID=3040349 RepID=UPI0024AFEB69|nr:HAMP domain-containing sensor histidine kinase [Asticcacaulis sp. EMRT-3]MDI7773867.1 HAMP domain-containing sensor histidine kinase [Asticcacaulis sp. EMRT-3]
MFDPGKTYPDKTTGPGGPAPRRGRLYEGFYARRLRRTLGLLAGASMEWGVSALTFARNFLFSLSGQLLILTLVFVMIVEVMIIIPRLAADQEDWLTDRVRSAEIASQAVDTARANSVSRATSFQLLRSAGVLYLRLQSNDRYYMLNPLPNLDIPDQVLDLRDSHKNMRHDLAYMWAPWQTLMGKPDRLIHLAARPRLRSGQEIEIVVRAEPLKTYLKSSLLGMLRMSISISLAAGILVFAALSAFIVRPIRRLTKNIQAFKTNPEDASAAPHRSSRRDEIGQIEQEMASMQEQVRQALRSRARLAALGQAVSKINHDLRNMLTAAQMASDRLATSGDPTVAKALPRLERALDRALSLAQNVLTYGKSDERAPHIQIVRLRELADAAAEDAGLGLSAQAGESVRFSTRVPKGFFLEADPEQLHRLLVNLMRNARQAIELQPNRRLRGRVTLTAIKTAQDVVLIVADNGPGIPEKLREKLFQPFTSSSTPGGSGLGLAISRELAQLHDGDVRLVQTGPEGTTFEIRLPLKG